MNPNELEQSIIDRYKRYDEVAEKETKYEEYKCDDADIVLVAYGITSRICKTAIAAARAKGIKVGLIRARSRSGRTRRSRFAASPTRQSISSWLS